ncbi:hypothetical protein GCM10010336_69410 [Streptomyces goshikiensis]|nr:hypothetical protein GCM10010336_69410 [Streptomyces goshikiensis]
MTGSRVRALGVPTRAPGPTIWSRNRVTAPATAPGGGGRRPLQARRVRSGFGAKAVTSRHIGRPGIVGPAWSRKPFRLRSQPRPSDLCWGARNITDTPIYDAVEREWLARGRAVPRAPESWSMRGAASTDDLLLRA